MGRPKADVTNEQRFWAQVVKGDGCWVWTGYTNASGYGRVRWNGPQILAHRVSWQLANGRIPAGMLVLHQCDNPPCVNPRHLYLGTKMDNSRDMDARGRRRPPRAARGAANVTAKLTAAEADMIRRLRPTGRAALAMAAALGVHPATIRRVVVGKTYRPLVEGAA